ncbi:MAG: hypothetical protein VB118_07385 [Oscillospiraceae bacterium]|nr:hypothetical protein [Oscillospiraceae bacterium]
MKIFNKALIIIIITLFVMIIMSACYDGEIPTYIPGASGGADDISTNISKTDKVPSISLEYTSETSSETKEAFVPGNINYYDYCHLYFYSKDWWINEIKFSPTGKWDGFMGLFQDYPLSFYDGFSYGSKVFKDIPQEILENAVKKFEDKMHSTNFTFGEPVLMFMIRELKFTREQVETLLEPKELVDLFMYGSEIDAMKACKNYFALFSEETGLHMVYDVSKMSKEDFEKQKINDNELDIMIEKLRCLPEWTEEASYTKIAYDEVMDMADRLEKLKIN